MMRTWAIALSFILAVGASAATSRNLNAGKKSARRARAIATGDSASAPRSAHRVTLDVADEDSRAILASLQKQCGVRNLVIDPDVQGRGTFFFRDVTCDVAFRAVFESLSLSATGLGHPAGDEAVIAVKPR